MKNIIIIGAGVIGCSLADNLAQRGASVTVIDSAESGTGTSAATFAWVNSHDKTPAEYSRLNLLGLEAHERSAAADAGGRGWFHQTGTIQIAHTPDELEQIEAKVERFTANEYEARQLTTSEVLELEPSLDGRGILGGALYPREGWIDVQTMCASLLHRALGNGATFAPFETVLEVNETRVTTMTSHGTRKRSADAVILAAGNGTRRILNSAGIDFPIIDAGGPGGSQEAEQATVGIISTTSPINAGIRHLVRSEGVALRPARNGGITFADHPTGGKWEIDDPRIWTVPALLLERARLLYPALRKVSTETVSLGTRVLPEDGLTIADWVTDNHSIYAVATHSGVTLASHLAEVVADEVLTGTRDQSLSTFGLTRFATT